MTRAIAVLMASLSLTFVAVAVLAYLACEADPGERE